jgi:hypothetical protein
MIELSLSYGAAAAAAFVFMVLVWSLAFGFYSAGYSSGVNRRFLGSEDDAARVEASRHFQAKTSREDQARSPHQSEYLASLADRIGD